MGDKGSSNVNPLKVKAFSLACKGIENPKKSDPFWGWSTLF
jgi:hypothetical protein